MKHYVKPKCKYECRFLQISDELWMCKHMAYGSATSRLGAVEEGRRLLERAGGYDAVLARIQQREEEQRIAAKERANKQRERLAGSVRHE